MLGRSARWACTGAQCGVPGFMDWLFWYRDSGGDKAQPGRAGGAHSGGSKRVIRSRRVQERVARIEGDGDNAFHQSKPLCITVALSKEEIHNDLVSIIGHKRTPRAKRSNIPAMVRPSSPPTPAVRCVCHLHRWSCCGLLMAGWFAVSVMRNVHSLPVHSFVRRASHCAPTSLNRTGIRTSSCD